MTVNDLAFSVKMPAEYTTKNPVMDMAEMKEDEETTQKKEGDDTDDTSDEEAEERNDRVGATQSTNDDL